MVAGVMSTLAVPLAARPSPRTFTVAALAALYLVWSSTYLALRHVVTAMPPMFAGALRFAAAGAVLFALQRLRGAPWPEARSWRPAAASGVAFFALANGVLGLAETRVSSGVAAVVFASTPVFVAALGALHGERPSPRERVGIALGVAGVALLAAGSDLRSAGARGVLLLVSPLAWAVGTAIARRAQPASPVTFAAQQMVCGAAAMAVVSGALGERVSASVPMEAWAALGYLVVFGSVLGFSAYAYLVRHARPAVATSYAYVNPALAVLLGAAVDGEPLRATTFASLSLVLAAVVTLCTKVGARAPRA